MTTRGGHAQMQFKAESGDPPQVIIGLADKFKSYKSQKFSTG